MEPTLFEEYSESDRQDLIVSYSIEIQYLSKLYVMMALQFLLTIILTYIRLPLIESSIAAYPYLVFILGAILFALSYLASFCKKLPLNVLIYFTFTIVLYFFFADLAIRTNVEQALMAQSLILGQILGQLLLTLQSRTQILHHQSFLYVLVSGMLVFQLFVVLSHIPFYEMIIIYVVSILYGAMLVFGTMTNLRDYASVCSNPDYYRDAISGSVRAQFDLTRSALYTTQLLQGLVFDDRKLMIKTQD